MQYKTKENKLETSKETMSVELGLGDTQKAIELLYSQYSMPIRTCVQELVSNAFDAMLDADNPDKPIDVTLPNSMNNNMFSVRDYGQSMDFDTIKNVYMKVNTSTKSKSNKAIGGFGIGSKTPWAYTDTFILKTYLNGLETHYTMVKGRSSVNVTYEAKTDKANGTEVTFKAKDEHVDVFLHSLKRISLCARIKPNVTNAKHLNLSFNKEVKVNDSIRVVESELLSKTTYLSIGGVLYETKSKWLAKDRFSYLDNALYDCNGLLLNSTLIVDIPVGKIMPLQTREGIFTQGSEGEENIKVLKEVFESTKLAIKQYMSDEFKKVTNVKEAIEFFKGSLIKSNDRFKDNSIEVSSDSISLDKSDSITFLSRESSRYSYRYRSYTKLTKAKKWHTRVFSLDKLKLPIYFTDLSPNKARLASRLHNKLEQSDIIVLEKSVMKDDKAYNTLIKALGAIDVTEVTIPKIDRARQVKDKDEVVIYDRHGRKKFTYNISRDNRRIGKTIITGKDSYLKYPTCSYKFLGFNIWYVAKGNMSKLTDLTDRFISPEKAMDLKPMADQFIEHNLALFISNYQRPIDRYIFDKVKLDKEKLVVNCQPKYRFYSGNKTLVNDIKAKHGDYITKELQRRVRNYIRLSSLMDNVPLLKHIDNVDYLSKAAKKDLDEYIVTKFKGIS